LAPISCFTLLWNHDTSVDKKKKRFVFHSGHHWETAL
jgi:hypothetical protein